MNKHKTESFKEIHDLFDKFYLELQSEYELNEKKN